jgi:hypothetical protein
MTKNIHPIERIIRVIVGVAIMSFASYSKWYLLGIIPVATGLMGWCPPYQLLGFSTCPLKKESGQ